MRRSAEKIYVQIDIDCPLDKVWQLTQTPELHQRWDLRFTEISYLPRPDPAQPQQFVYATRIGFGLGIRGEGETVGHIDAADGMRSSALKFWSDDPKSLIHKGSGYWKYLPMGDSGNNTRFLTLYDYNARFGPLGRWFDRLVFRPLMGWATAWSFDRLRLWIERGIDPATSMRLSVAYAVARLTVALVWLYQGLIPKLIFKHADELAMLRTLTASDSNARFVCMGMGWVEIAIGIVLILGWRFRGLLWFTLIAMVVAVSVVVLKAPAFLAAPFNPISLNVSVFALAAVALLIGRDLPSARRCVRTLPKEQR